MHKLLKENPKTSITAVVSFVTALLTGGFAGYDSIQNIATKQYVNAHVTELNLEMVDYEIKYHEAELMRIEFLIETNKAETVDKLLKTKSEQALTGLRMHRNEILQKHNKNK